MLLYLITRAGASLPGSLKDLLTLEISESRVKVLKEVMAKPGNQRSLSLRSGLATGTVSGAVKDLGERGLITAKGGVVSLNPVSGALVGVELGFGSAAVVIRQAHVRWEEAVVKQVEAGAVPKGDEESRWPRQIADAVREALTELGETEVVAIGLGVPRAVNPHDGQLVPPLLYPWSKGDDPAGILMHALREQGIDVSAPQILLDNDANLAALAESSYQYPEAEVLVAVTAGIGVGSGIVIGGKPFRGRTGLGGEIGHIAIEIDGEICPCGGRGCLETVVGGDALLRQARIGRGGIGAGAPDSLEDLVAMAYDGDVVCRRVLTESAGMLGWALGSVCNVFNPQVVVLGGILKEARTIMLDPCVSGFRRTAMRAARDRDEKVFQMKASDLGHSVAHGATILAIEGTYPARG